MTEPPPPASVPARSLLEGAPLGRATACPECYAPQTLFSIPRAPQRAVLGIGAGLPFGGSDQWTAYELTWLDPRGQPQIAVAALDFPADSPSMVESKSMKLYLGSYAQTVWRDAGEVTAVLARDLSNAAGATVAVKLAGPECFSSFAMRELAGVCLDQQTITCDRYDVDPSLLEAAGSDVTELLMTRLFHSVCPVTGQPDLASLQIGYRGPRIDRAGLLRYLVSYRRHPGFHEQCVERIFVDVVRACRCTSLTVYARFTRRGGIEINPFRTNAGVPAPANLRTPRQ